MTVTSEIARLIKCYQEQLLSVTTFLLGFFYFVHIGCGRTRRVNWVYFSETWLKILNNLAWLKVGYNKITGLHFMSSRTEMGYEVG